MTPEQFKNIFSRASTIGKIVILRRVEQRVRNGENYLDFIDELITELELEHRRLLDTFIWEEEC